MSRTGHIRICEAKNGQLFFKIVAANNETLAHSETYTQPRGCLNGINAAIECASIDKLCILRYSDTPRRDPYFLILAANFKVLIHSETYKEVRKCRHGLQRCREILKAGRIVDTTGQFPDLSQA